MTRAITKIIFLIIVLFVLFGLWQKCFALELLLEYPPIDGKTLGEQSTLPQLIEYIYKFALGICGITALVSILIGAFQYVSAGSNSSKLEDAKDRITQALLGVLILLAAVLILRTINPDLVRLSLDIGGSSQTTGWACYYCHYPITYPDPSMYCDKNKFPNRFIYKQFCSTDITTEAQANNECVKFKAVNNLFFLVKQEICN